MAVAGLKSTAEVVNAHGRLTVSDVKGDTRLENKFGAVEVSGIGGALSITNANGTSKTLDIPSADYPNIGDYALAVTIKYNFKPLTPFGSQFFPTGIVMTVTSTMSTEY